MNGAGLRERLACGAAAGFAGTFTLQVLRTASQRWLARTMPPFRQDPGEFLVEQAEKALPEGPREQMPALAETAAAKALAGGYGLTAGALYALLRPRGSLPCSDGAAFGLSVWAVGYLGWLPALGLLAPVNRQRVAATVGQPVRHVLFEIVTVAAYHWLRRRLAEN